MNMKKKCFELANTVIQAPWPLYYVLLQESNLQKLEDSFEFVTLACQCLHHLFPLLIVPRTVISRSPRPSIFPAVLCYYHRVASCEWYSGAPGPGRHRTHLPAHPGAGADHLLSKLPGRAQRWEQYIYWRKLTWLFKYYSWYYLTALFWVYNFANIYNSPRALHSRSPVQHRSLLSEQRKLHIKCHAFHFITDIWKYFLKTLFITFRKRYSSDRKEQSGQHQQVGCERGKISNDESSRTKLSTGRWLRAVSSLAASWTLITFRCSISSSCSSMF